MVSAARLAVCFFRAGSPPSLTSASSLLAFARATASGTDVADPSVKLRCLDPVTINPSARAALADTDSEAGNVVVKPNAIFVAQRQFQICYIFPG